MRRFALVLVIAVAACSSPAHTAAPPPPRCVSVPHSDELAAVAELDRQIVTLHALVAVPGLDSVYRSTMHSAGVARIQSHHASSAVASVARSAAPYLDDRAPDAATIEHTIQGGYRRESASVREAAQVSEASYDLALGTQVRKQDATLVRLLQQRVDDAYAARLQLYTERENDAEVARETLVANRQLQLRIKLQALAHTSAQRRSVQSELDAITQSLASRSQADRRRDRAQLAVYLHSLQAAASSEYASAAANLQRSASANLALRRKVAQVQLGVLEQAPVPFDVALRAAMRDGADSLATAMQSTNLDAASTSVQFLAAGNDVARRLTSIATSTSLDAASLRTELRAMLRTRSALERALSHSCGT